MRLATAVGGSTAQSLTIDVDGTLIGSRSEKEGAAGNFKGGYGFHPMLAYADQSGEALAGELRPGNAGANTAADQITVAEHAINQIPKENIQDIEILLRADSAGASHDLLDWCRHGRIRFSVGYELSETVRTQVLQITEQDWVSAVEQDGTERANRQVAEITAALDLTGWPTGSRVIVRRERAHPGEQLTFTDHDGHRFGAILTDQPGQVREIERRHRARAHVEDHIRNDKDTGMRNLPFKDFEHNRIWLQIVLIAHDLITWIKRLLLTGQLAKAEPKRLRYRILHVAGRLSFHARTATLRLQASWPRGHRAHQRIRPPGRAPCATRLTPASPPSQTKQAPTPGAPRSMPVTAPPTAPKSASATCNPHGTPTTTRSTSPTTPEQQNTHTKHLAARSGLTTRATPAAGGAFEVSAEPGPAHSAPSGCQWTSSFSDAPRGSGERGVQASDDSTAGGEPGGSSMSPVRGMVFQEARAPTRAEMVDSMITRYMSWR